MNQKDKIKATIETVREKYDLDKYKANRAIIQAPFGQKHFDEGIQRLTDSKAVKELAESGQIAVFVITSTETKIGSLPDWITCIRVNKVPDWPEHPAYQNRFFKWAIPFLFPNIKTSLYLDSDISISSKQLKLSRAFKKVESSKFLVTKHNVRKNWCAEYRAILRHSVLSRIKLYFQFLFYLINGISTSTRVYQNKMLGRVHKSDLNVESMHFLVEIEKAPVFILPFHLN